MSVKGPTSPLSSGAEPLEPLDSKDLQKTVQSGKFASELSQALESAATEAAGETAQTDSPTLQGLKGIAANADFATEEKLQSAIRESAKFMIKSRIQDKFKERESVSDMLDELSEFVTKDPLLNRKLKSILERLKQK